jgi:hypothetical protein
MRVWWNGIHKVETIMFAKIGRPIVRGILGGIFGAKNSDPMYPTGWLEERQRNMRDGSGSIEPEITVPLVDSKSSIYSGVLKAIDLAVNILSQELRVKVRVIYSKNMDSLGLYSPGNKCVTLLDSPFHCDFYRVLNTLAHEMRHAVQFQHAGFFTSENKWIGPTYDVKKNDRYDADWYYKPCEIDARAYEDCYTDLVLNDPTFIKFLNE